MTPFNMESLIPFALFGAVALGAWVLLEAMGNRNTRTNERLDEFKNPITRKRDGKKKQDGISKMIERASPALAKPLQPKNELEAGKLKTRLIIGGFRGEMATSIFLGLKFLGLMFGVVMGGGGSLAFYGASQKALISSVAVCGTGFFLPDVVLWFLSKRRKDAIFLGLPDTLDLLVVCVEAGLGLDQGMRKVSEEMKLTCRVLSDEIQLSNFQLQMGRSRGEVLHELGARTGVDDVRSLAAILIQADKFGSSIAQALRVQSDAMRTRRRQLAEERAAKTAVKLIFPLVLFIFPGIFVVLVGPAAITMVRQMLPVMNR